MSVDRPKTALGLSMLLLAWAASAQADVKAGVDAWTRGEYKRAVEQWRPPAVAGDPDAQFNLGQAYKLGRGVPVDLALAEQWYAKAAAQGHFQAEDNYGLTLFQTGKRSEAVRWLERSSARGEPRAQLVLGTMLFNGDIITKDWVRAYALLTRSSAAGLPQGSATLGQMDQYIAADVRQQGIALARQYEEQAQRPPNPPEIAGGSSGVAMQTTELAPSVIAGNGNQDKPSPTLKQPPPTAKPKSVAVVDMPTGPARSVTGRGWRVQFGAFRDESNARNLWTELQRRVGSLAKLQPYLVKSVALTKLQAGPLTSSNDAARICADVRAKAAGTDCVPIAP